MSSILTPGERPDGGNILGDVLRRVLRLEAVEPGGGISEITSTDGSVTITDPTGPVVDLSASPIVIVNGETVVFPQRSGFWYMPQFTDYGSAISTQGLGILQVSPFFVPADTTFDRIGVLKQTGNDATQLFRMGIYANVLTGISYPGALILDAGTVTGAGLGNTERTITISQFLPSGMYWTAGVPQSVFGMGVWGYNHIQWINQTHTTLVGMRSGVNPSTYETTGVTGALPSTFPAFGTATFINSTVVGAVGLRAA